MLGPFQYICSYFWHVELDVDTQAPTTHGTSVTLMGCLLSQSVTPRTSFYTNLANIQISPKFPGTCACVCAGKGQLI